MKWTKERYQLIAQTMAFVQSIAVKKPEIETGAESGIEFAPVEPRVELPPVESLSVKLAAAEAIEKIERPIETLQAARPRPIPRSDIREEIQGRVAAFRAHQQLFHRERDAYFNSVFAGVRGFAESPPPKAPGG